MRLGGAGTLKSNPRVVLRAHLTPDPGVEQLGAYWVARTYDTFDGQEWTSVGNAKRSRPRVTLRPGGERSIHQRIELLPAYGARTLVALETPTRLGNAVAHHGERQPPHAPWWSSAAARCASRRAPSPTPTRPPACLQTRRPSTQLTEVERGQLLALPDRLDPRVEELARRVLNGETDPLAAAQKLSAWLQREYAYTLELGGDVEDPLADFLFERKAGHCEHFATALTIMLRTQGFSARLSTGFFGGERSNEDYILRAGDAHAWTHVLVPDRGFVTLDATPPGNRASQGLPALQFLTGIYEAHRGALAHRRHRLLAEGSAGRGPEAHPPTARARPLLRPPAPRARLGPGPAGGPAHLRHVAHPRRRLSAPRPLAATQLIDTVEGLLREAGLRPRPDETLEELTSRLVREQHSLAEPLAPLTRRYLEARFGQRPLEAGEAERLLAPCAATSRLAAPAPRAPDVAAPGLLSLLARPPRARA